MNMQCLLLVTHWTTLETQENGHADTQTWVLPLDQEMGNTDKKGFHKLLLYQKPCAISKYFYAGPFWPFHPEET